MDRLDPREQRAAHPHAADDLDRRPLDGGDVFLLHVRGAKRPLLSLLRQGGTNIESAILELHGPAPHRAENR